MAGEIEEPFNFGFQADSFRSGSISFGRFENESLSWERRSSFSHNRYLEEVEKCSKPGSVIEKKAYFEAHFKKKALRHQNSSESQNAREYDTSDNEVSENMDDREECDNVNGGSESACTNGGSSGNLNYWEDNNVEERNQLNYVDDAIHSAHFKEELGNVDYGEEFDRGNGGGQFRYLDDSGTLYAYYDKSPKGSEHCKEYEVAASGVENLMVFPSDLEIEGSMSKSNSVIDGVLEDGTQETNQNEICSGKLLNDGETETEVNQRADDISTSFESSRPFNLSPKNKNAEKVDKSTLEHRRTHSAKLMAGEVRKSTKLGLKSQVSTVAKGSSNNSSRTSAKNQNIMEKESQRRAKKEKLPSQAAIPARHSPNRYAKKEDTEMTETKKNIESRSEKAIRMKKVTEPQSSASKVEPSAHQSPNRLTVSSTKLNTRTIGATFNFKNSERAERRNEFCNKLEKEMRAKKADMKQLRAITKEKKEAEIKQFRRNLNFKATPMPSFYSAGSIGSKDASSIHKPGKVQNKLNTGGAAVRSTPCFKARNDRTVLATESPSQTDHPKFSEASICTAEPSYGHSRPLIPPTNTNGSAEAITIDGITGKKEWGKIQKHQIPDDDKMTKDLKVKSKLKVGARRNDGEAASKQMRGTEIGNSSRMGHLPVGVAS